MQSKKIPLSPASELLRGGGVYYGFILLFFQDKKYRWLCTFTARVSGIFIRLIKKSILRQAAFFDYKCDNRSRHQKEENNDSLQYEWIVRDGKPAAI